MSRGGLRTVDWSKQVMPVAGGRHVAVPTYADDVFLGTPCPLNTTNSALVDDDDVLMPNNIPK